MQNNWGYPPDFVSKLRYLKHFPYFGKLVLLTLSGPSLCLKTLEMNPWNPTFSAKSVI